MQEFKNQEEPISKVEEVKIQKESTNGDEELIQDKSFLYCLRQFYKKDPLELINGACSRFALNKYYEYELLICVFSLISKETSEEIKNQIKTSIRANSELNDKMNYLCDFFIQIQNEIIESHTLNPIVKIIEEEGRYRPNNKIIERKKLYRFNRPNMSILIIWVTSIIRSNDHLTFECENFWRLCYVFEKFNTLDEPIFIESILELELVSRAKQCSYHIDRVLNLFIKFSNILGRKLTENDIYPTFFKNFQEYDDVDIDVNIINRSEFAGKIKTWISFFDVCAPGSFTPNIINSIIENNEEYTHVNFLKASLQCNNLEIFEEKKPFDGSKLGTAFIYNIIFKEKRPFYGSDGSKLCTENIYDYKSSMNFLELCKEGTFPQDKTLIYYIIQIIISKCKITDEFLSDELLAFPSKSLDRKLIYCITEKFSGDLSEIGLRNLISRCEQSEPFYNMNLDFEDKYNCEIPFLSRFNGTLTEDLILDLSKFFHVDSIIGLIKSKFGQQQIPYEIFKPACFMFEKCLKKRILTNSLHVRRIRFYKYYSFYELEKYYVLYLFDNCDYRENIQEFTNTIYSYALLKLDHKNIFDKTDYEAFWNTVKTTPTIRPKFLFALIMHVFDTKQFDEKTKLLFENAGVKKAIIFKTNINELYANEPIMLKTLHIFIHNNPEVANLLKGYFSWDFKAIQIEVHNKNANTRSSDSESEKSSLKPQMEQAKTIAENPKETNPNPKSKNAIGNNKNDFSDFSEEEDR